MNPSGAPSVIERFTSLVGFCIGLNSLSNTRLAVAKAALKKVASNPDLAMTEREVNVKQSSKQPLGASAGPCLNYRLGLPWF